MVSNTNFCLNFEINLLFIVSWCFFLAKHNQTVLEKYHSADLNTLLIPQNCKLSSGLELKIRAECIEDFQERKYLEETSFDFFNTGWNCFQKFGFRGKSNILRVQLFICNHKKKFTSHVKKYWKYETNTFQFFQTSYQ